MTRGLLGVAAFFCTISLPLPVTHSSTQSNTIREIRFSTHDTFTRVVIECDGEIVYSQNLLRFPDRLYFDLNNTVPPGNTGQEFMIDDAAVQSVRVGRYDAMTSRIVIHLKTYADFNVYNLENPSRLVIEVNHEQRKEEPRVLRDKIVVIDPGHGGRDPGAIGRRGLREKDVVLDIARKLREILESRSGFKVHLTRNDDRYLELGDRTKCANQYDADLFVSIHANASPNRKTRGIETWFLDIPSNEYDEKIAARENAISVEKMKMTQTVEGLILADMARDRKRDESIRLAHYVQNSLMKHMRARYKRSIDDHGVKYSLFYVLVGAEMPAVLIETGFITNFEDELMLRKSTYRNDLAQAIAKAVHSYLSTLPDVQEPGLPKLARR